MYVYSKYKNLKIFRGGGLTAVSTKKRMFFRTDIGVLF